MIVCIQIPFSRIVISLCDALRLINAELSSSLCYAARSQQIL